MLILIHRHLHRVNREISVRSRIESIAGSFEYCTFECGISEYHPIQSQSSYAIGVAIRNFYRLDVLQKLAKADILFDKLKSRCTAVLAGICEILIFCCDNIFVFILSVSFFSDFSTRAKHVLNTLQSRRYHDHLDQPLTVRTSPSPPCQNSVRDAREFCNRSFLHVQ